MWFLFFFVHFALFFLNFHAYSWTYGFYAKEENRNSALFFILNHEKMLQICQKYANSPNIWTNFAWKSTEIA